MHTHNEIDTPILP